MKRVSPEEFLAQFDRTVHRDLVLAISRTQATHLVCYENQTLDSSHLGERTALCVGPLCTVQTLEQAMMHWLGDLPSVRQHPKNWCTADELLSVMATDGLCGNSPK